MQVAIRPSGGPQPAGDENIRMHSSMISRVLLALNVASYVLSFFSYVSSSTLMYKSADQLFGTCMRVV